MSGEEILNFFYDRIVFERAENGWKVPFIAENWRGAKPAFDVVDAKTGEVVFAAGHKISPRLANKAAKDGLETLLIPTEEIFGRYSAYDQIGRASCRERVCPYVSISVVAVALKIKKKYTITHTT